MSNAILQYHKSLSKDFEINVPLSKSIYNRLLILKKLYFPNLVLLNKSDSNDSILLENLLTQSFNNTTLDAQDAGTVFRFLTALLAISPSNCLLTGTSRMKERPIAGLVEMLQNIGAQITYEETHGFPPLRINGKPLTGGITLKTENKQSSQFFSAMAMIAPAFSKGLTLVLPENLGSKPYWDMTLKCMEQLRIPFTRQDELQFFFPHFEKNTSIIEYETERDWSAASFFILLPLLIRDLNITINGLSVNSIQGDSAFIIKYANALGLGFKPAQKGIRFFNNKQITHLSHLDFADSPDLSMNFIVVLALLQHDCIFSGLESLALKESNRSSALQKELKKSGIRFYQDGKNWRLETKDIHIPQVIEFDTYEDHRIAMALSYFALFAHIQINQPEVVSKSFPNFWIEAAKTGIQSSN